MNTEVRPLLPENAARAAVALAEAFADDPAYALMFADARTRVRAFQALWPALIRYSLRWGQAYEAHGGDALSLWLPPGDTKTTAWRGLRAGLWKAVLTVDAGTRRYFTDTIDHLDSLHARLVPEKHWYLWVLGVRPELQGRGVGTALLEPTLERAQAAGLPVYLEAITEENVAYYEHRGFEVVAAGTIPGRDFPYWCMVHR